MQALILAGGKGTRLRPLTVYTPKPMVPLINRPFLLYQIEILRNAGIKDITLSLSYQPDKIQHSLGNGSEFGVNLRFVTEPSPLGTGGAYAFAADPSTETVVFNGDILTDLDVSKLVAFHKKKNADATIVLTSVERPEQYGLVETDADQKVVQFLEKPDSDEVRDLGINTINAGIYVLKPTILDLIPKGANRSFEFDVFPAIIKKGLPFFAHTLQKEYWRDIGTCASYLEAHNDYLQGKVQGFTLDGAGASEIATAAFVDKRSVIGDNCIIKPGAKIVNSVLGNGVTVEEKAVIENSVVWPHARISAYAELFGAIIGRGSHIGRNAVIGEGTVLGDKASIPDYSRV